MNASMTAGFFGGLILECHKSLSNVSPIQEAGLAARFVYPLPDINGQIVSPDVSVGERVLRGQPLAGGHNPLEPPIHASTSGWIIGIENHPAPCPKGVSTPCIILGPDGLDEAIPPLSTMPHPDQHTIEAVRSRIHEAGIIGLGGAGFPTAAKLKSGRTIHTLIINGAECEPYITCDEMLLRERAGEILRGADILRRCLGAAVVLIAVEANKPLAISALTETMAQANDAHIRVVPIPSRYPVGGEKQLVQILTGQEVPSGAYPPDIGVHCQNAATTAAIYRAVVRGQRLDSRIITVTGRGVTQPQNLEVRLGTPISHLIERCGGYTESAERLFLSGSMMGYPVDSDDLPITKSINAVVVAARDELSPDTEPQPCIRCGACTEVCPARLMPQQLYEFSKSGKHQKAVEIQLFDCIECRCCDVVCPSHIPLVDFFKSAKQAARTSETKRLQANHARMRYEARMERKSREHRQREMAAQGARQGLDQSAAARIEDAIKRVRLKRPPAPSTSTEDTGS